MRKTLRVREYRLDDWVALYVNGILVFQNHDYETYVLLDEINKFLPFEKIDFESIWDIDELYYQFEDEFGGMFPATEQAVIDFLESNNE